MHGKNDIFTKDKRNKSVFSHSIMNISHCSLYYIITVNVFGFGLPKKDMEKL